MAKIEDHPLSYEEILAAYTSQPDFSHLVKVLYVLEPSSPSHEEAINVEAEIIEELVADPWTDSTNE